MIITTTYEIYSKTNEPIWRCKQEIVNELEKELNQLQDPAGDNRSLTQAKSKLKNKVINKDISENVCLLSNGDSDEEETIKVAEGINVEKEDVTDWFSR